MEQSKEAAKSEVSLKDVKMTEKEKLLLRKKRFQSEATRVPTSQMEEVIKAEEEKKKARAARFGLVSDEERFKARAKKFGIVSDEEKMAKRLKKFKTADTSDETKMAARAKRFGLNSNNTTDEAEKKKARAERFGLNTHEEKMKKRLERFAKPT